MGGGQLDCKISFFLLTTSLIKQLKGRFEGTCLCACNSEPYLAQSQIATCILAKGSELLQAQRILGVQRLEAPQMSKFVKVFQNRYNEMDTTYLRVEYEECLYHASKTNHHRFCKANI